MTFSIPSEFSNEDRWFKYFTMKSLLVLILFGGITYGIAQITLLFGSAWPGLILGGIITALAVASTMIPISEAAYLSGAGLTIDIYIFRRLLRKINKVVYIKGYSK